MKTLEDAVTSDARGAKLKKKKKKGLKDPICVLQFAGTLREKWPNFRIFPENPLGKTIFKIKTT